MIRSTLIVDCKLSWIIYDRHFFCCQGWTLPLQRKFPNKNRWRGRRSESTVLEKWISTNNLFERYSGTMCDQNIFCIWVVWNQVLLMPRSMYLSNIDYMKFYCGMDTLCLNSYTCFQLHSYLEVVICHTYKSRPNHFSLSFIVFIACLKSKTSMNFRFMGLLSTWMRKIWEKHISSACNANPIFSHVHIYP